MQPAGVCEASARWDTHLGEGTVEEVAGVWLVADVEESGKRQDLIPPVVAVVDVLTTRKSGSSC